MGKTHLSGLEIGDVGIDIWASPSLNQKVRLAALNSSQRLHFPEGAHITMLRVADGTGALIVATVKIGTAAGGTQIFTGSSVAATPLSVEKYAPPGYAYVEVSAGAVPLWVIVSYIAALNA